MVRLALIVCVLAAGCTHIIAPVENYSIDVGDLPQRQNDATYKVVAGDTLYSIAISRNLDPEVLARNNGIAKPYIIHLGQVLKLSAAAKKASTKRKSVYTSRKPTPASPVSTPAKQEQKRNARIAAQKAALEQVNLPKSRSNTSNEAPPSAWRWPVKAKVGRKFISSKKRLHKGIDLMGKRGVSVLSTAEGRVRHAGGNVPGYGNLVLVEHPGGYFSAYAHLQDISVVRGALVEAGGVLGSVGDSDTDKVHLHFEIRKGNLALDPAALLPPKP